MQILPSLLEYSKKDIQEKVIKILNSKSKFIDISNQNTDLLALHLDFVLPKFAENRGVKPGVNFSETVEAIKNSTSIYPDQKLDLSVHFMGEDEDMKEVLNQFQISKFPSSWNLRIFVSPKHYLDFEKFNSGKIQVGLWYDWEEWEVNTFANLTNSSTFDASNSLKNAKTIPKSFLLMTVKAGKSGQKRTPKSIDMVFEAAKNLPQNYFICDGGWQVEDLKPEILNLDMVSYSSFWKSFIS